MAIAGINFQVIFENIPQSQLQVKFFSRMKKSFSQFILAQNPTQIDFVLIVQSVETKRFFLVNHSHSTVLFKSVVKINEKSYTVFDHVSIYQFLLILIDIMKDAIIVQNGFVMHASGIVDKNKAVLFTGPSGSGKSTIALMLKQGVSMLADDYIVVKRINNKYICYRLPTLVDNSRYRYIPQALPLKAICLVCQSKDYTLIPLTDKSYLNQLMRSQVITDSLRDTFTRNFLTSFVKRNRFYKINFGLNRRKVVNLLGNLSDLN